MTEEKDAGADIVSRIYEVGYHIASTVKEEDVEKVVSALRGEIEKGGGSFIAEGSPSLMKLAFPMIVREGEKKIVHDRAYFGWIKFEAPTEAAEALEASLKRNTNIVRAIVFRTVREDTRAKYKAPTLREVKRTDTIKSSPRRAPEATEKAPVSEAELDKALEHLTTE
ncbi:30S ribosomal protein S6 [Candidatus Kaiserbacteria bacterium]|nr:30S ribosomal protein S6 [Candidatus Kaiserbacteria bacterium]